MNKRIKTKTESLITLFQSEGQRDVERPVDHYNKDGRSIGKNAFVIFAPQSVLRSAIFGSVFSQITRNNFSVTIKL